jgi:hypothetical protein
MSDSLEERLSRFTPDPAGLERDRLLFAAGRASVRPGRRWVAVAGALAASQLLTLVFLWPRSGPPDISHGPLAGPTVAALPTQPPAPLPPSTLGALYSQMLSGDSDLSPPAPSEAAAPADAPLRLGAALRSMLLN